MKKKIAIIARGLETGGVQKFLIELLNVWNGNEQVKFKHEIIVISDSNDFSKLYPNLKVVYIPKLQKLIWDYIFLLIVLLFLKPSSVLYTKNIVPFTHFFCSWKKFTIVYDLAFMYPKLRAYKIFDTLYMRLFLGMSLRFSNKIICISDFTKSEVKKFFNYVKDEKISVIKLGVSDIYKRQSNKKIIDNFLLKYQIKKPFILYCGSISPRKNILNLLKAFNLIKKEVPHTLYLVGGRGWNNLEIYSYWKKYSLQKRVMFLDFMPENDLITFYSLASAYVYVSLYEGFGLPVVEAQAIGCPLVVSDNMLYNEIAAKSNSVSVDPESPRSIAKGIKKAVLIKNIKTENLHANWNQVAEKYLEVLCS